jgi:hypothetical protein
MAAPIMLFVMPFNRSRSVIERRFTTEATEFTEKSRRVFSVLSVRSVVNLFLLPAASFIQKKFPLWASAPGTPPYLKGK